MDLKLKEQIRILINRFNADDYLFVINKITILLKKNSSNDFLWNLLGFAYQRGRLYEKSLYPFKKALELNPLNLAAKNNLGNTYKYLKDFDNAEQNFKEIIKINPSYINALVNLANLKIESNNFEESIKILNDVLNLNENLTMAYINLAYAYQSIGEIEKAKVKLYDVLKIDPTLTKADKMLSVLIDYSLEVSHLEQMIDKSKKYNLNDQQKVQLYFAISKAYEDKNDYTESFNYLKIGNKLQGKNVHYNKDNTKKLSDSIKSYFKNFNYENERINSDNKKIIFIFGMPRSGTTITERIISNHSEVSSMGELGFTDYTINKDIIIDFEINTDLIDSFYKKDFTKDYYKFTSYFKNNGSIIADKTLMNFWYIGFIKIFFPNAKFIHCFRNPKDNCLSIYKNLFDGEMGWGYDEEELADYYNIYKDLMNFWNQEIDGEILNLEYENLLKNSDLEIKKIIKFCDLEWEESCLNFTKKSIPIKTLSVNQANKPLYNTSVNSSKNFINKLNILFSKLN